MRTAILSSVACPALPYFSWGGGVTEHEMCFDFLYKSVSDISHSKKDSASYDKKKWPVVLM